MIQDDKIISFTWHYYDPPNVSITPAPTRLKIMRHATDDATEVQEVSKRSRTSLRRHKFRAIPSPVGHRH